MIKRISIFLIIIILGIAGFYLYLRYHLPIRIGVIYYNSENYGPNETPDVAEVLRNDLKKQIQIYYAGISSDIEIKDVISYLNEKGIKFIIGPTTSSQALEMIPLLEKYNMVAIAPKVTSPLVVGTSANFFSIVPTDEIVAVKLAEKMNKDMVKRVLVFRDRGNPTFTGTFEKYFKEGFAGQVIASEPVNGADIQLNLRSLERADAVLFLTTPYQTGILVQKIRQINSEIKFYASDYSIGRALIEFGGEAIQGLMIISLFDNRYLSGEGKEEADKLQQMGLDINQNTINYYDALHLLLELIEKYGKNPSIIKRELKGYSFAGVGGKLHIDEQGIPYRNVTLVRLEDGEFKTAEIMEVFKGGK